MSEQGKSVRSPSPEEEGAAEAAFDELTLQPPFPVPLHRTVGEGIENWE